MPSTAASGMAAFSIPGSAVCPPMPQWASATTRSTPSARSLGTQAWAASTMSRTVTCPSRCARSHCMICGGTKPMMPMRIGWVAPAPSVRSRSITA